MAGWVGSTTPRRPAMTRTEIKPAVSAVKELLAQEPDALREIVRRVMQAMLEAEMDEALGAGKSAGSDARLGNRWGRSGESRVGQGCVRLCRSRWAPCQSNQKRIKPKKR